MSACLSTRTPKTAPKIRALSLAGVKAPQPTLLIPRKLWSQPGMKIIVQPCLAHIADMIMAVQLKSVVIQ